CCACAGRFCIFLFLTHRQTANFSTLSLHDALPICHEVRACVPLDLGVLLLRVVPARPTAHLRAAADLGQARPRSDLDPPALVVRSEEHTSELQSRENLVCRLLLEKKNRPDLEEARK